MFSILQFEPHFLTKIGGGGVKPPSLQAVMAMLSNNNPESACGSYVHDSNSFQFSSLELHLEFI